jgi:hypothetical protein
MDRWTLAHPILSTQNNYSKFYDEMTRYTGTGIGYDGTPWKTEAAYDQRGPL